MSVIDYVFKSSKKKQKKRAQRNGFFPPSFFFINIKIINYKYKHGIIVCVSYYQCSGSTTNLELIC